MIQFTRTLLRYHQLIAVMAWKQIVVRYKQSYLGLAWAILKPMMLMLVFTLLNSFVGISHGSIPYPVLAFTALIPWIFFQESISDGVISVVTNAALIRKIYFPREVFPLTGVLTKLVEFGINALILGCLMWYFRVVPAATIVWIPLLLLYTVLAALSIVLLGAAVNVFYRDVGTMLPILLQLLMYASPVIYPMSLVEKKLSVDRVAGAWSDLLLYLYRSNPIAGVIDGFQRTILYGQPPSIATLWPGMIVVAVLLPISYAVFKRAELHFADVV